MARPRIMAVLNVTPDSFFEGSRLTGADAAFEQARRAVSEGAELLDIGGESTRPGSGGVSEAEELARVIPVVARAARLGVPVSIDTSKAAVAREALKAGATILNDITALRGDAGMVDVAREYPFVILMHMQGTPRTMQQAPVYGDVMGDLKAFFRERLESFSAAGGDPNRVWIDPGIGFGKDLPHNLEILRRLGEFRTLGRRIVLGASRKSFIGRLLAAPGGEMLPAEERLEGSLAVACRAAEAGVDVLRVHDVKATAQTLEVFSAVRRPL